MARAKKEKGAKWLLVAGDREGGFEKDLMLVSRFARNMSKWLVKCGSPHTRGHGAQNTSQRKNDQRAKMATGFAGAEVPAASDS